MVDGVDGVDAHSEMNPQLFCSLTQSPSFRTWLNTQERTLFSSGELAPYIRYHANLPI